MRSSDLLVGLPKRERGFAALDILGPLLGRTQIDRPNARKARLCRGGSDPGKVAGRK